MSQCKDRILHPYPTASLTVYVHLELVVLVIGTGAVSTEAEALDFPCGREERNTQAGDGGQVYT